MKKLILTVFVITLNFHCIEMMTEAQMKSTAKLMRNVCQPKNKATNEQIDNMHTGTWGGEREVQCYMLCCLQMMKVITKAGNLDFDFAIKQVATLPQRYKQPTVKNLESCKESMTSSDLCEAGYQFAKCLYFADPEFYFLP